MSGKQFLVAALLALAPLLPPASASAKIRHVESSWTNPDFAKRDVRTIVILPAVTWDGNWEASSSPASTWLDAFSSSGYEWIPLSEVTRRWSEAPRQRDSLMKSIQAQIQNSGAVDAITARSLGTEFHAQGVLCLRVDRWEERLSGGSRNTATVELRCSLVDTSGTELWRIAGRSLSDGPLVKGSAIESSVAAPEKRVPASGGNPSPGGGGGGGRSSGSGGAGAPVAAASGANTGAVSVPASPGEGSSGVALRQGDSDDVSSIYRGALMSLFADWVPQLPPAAKRTK
jgi:hypothetical protein